MPLDEVVAVFYAGTGKQDDERQAAEAATGGAVFRGGDVLPWQQPAVVDFYALVADDGNGNFQQVFITAH